MQRWAFFQIQVLLRACLLAVPIWIFGAPTFAWASPPLMVMGDSLGEGVQSADANLRTQPNSYAVRVARQAGLTFPVPYILSWPLGVVGETTFRRRLSPYTEGANLAVSGADSWSVLNDRALATFPWAISSETELVLFPRTGSQIEIVEAIKPRTVLCWIGSNDVLSAVLAFDQLNETQIPLHMTQPEDFSSSYDELLSRLDQATEQVVLADIPDVTNIGFLVDNEDVSRFLGPGEYLPEGSRTTIAAVFMIRLGLAETSLLRDPDYILDREEIRLIQDRANALNEIIYDAAARHGFPVVKISEKFRENSENPPRYAGVKITPRYLEGFFSLDGVHPSNIGQALIANEFLRALKNQYGWSAPLLSESSLNGIAADDPFVDLDGDGRVRGRPLAGALETIGPILGISGDLDEGTPAPALQPLSRKEQEQALSLLDGLRDPGQRGSKLWTQEQLRDVFRKLFRP